MITDGYKNSVCDAEVNIYITSDEEIKEGDYMYDIDGDVGKAIGSDMKEFEGNKKIILTTDQDLIKDGVQAIDDEFLEWFVKNPSCEEVKIESWQTKGEWDLDYKIIISKEEQKQHLIDIMRGDEELGLYEEPKQESFVERMVPLQLKHNLDMTKQEKLEEAAYRLSAEKFEPKHIGFMLGVIEGAKWQQEQSEISDEEITKIAYDHVLYNDSKRQWVIEGMKLYREQFKKK
jgi:hypothetical protein